MDEPVPDLDEDDPFICLPPGTWTRDEFPPLPRLTYRLMLGVRTSAVELEKSGLLSKGQMPWPHVAGHTEYEFCNLVRDRGVIDASEDDVGNAVDPVVGWSKALSAFFDAKDTVPAVAERLRCGPFGIVAAIDGMIMFIRGGFMTLEFLKPLFQTLQQALNWVWKDDNRRPKPSPLPRHPGFPPRFIPDVVIEDDDDAEDMSLSDKEYVPPLRLAPIRPSPQAPRAQSPSPDSQPPPAPGSKKRKHSVPDTGSVESQPATAVPTGGTSTLTTRGGGVDVQSLIVGDGDGLDSPLPVDGSAGWALPPGTRCLFGDEGQRKFYPDAPDRDLVPSQVRTSRFSVQDQKIMEDAIAAIGEGISHISRIAANLMTRDFEAILNGLMRTVRVNDISRERTPWNHHQHEYYTREADEVANGGAERTREELKAEVKESYEELKADPVEWENLRKRMTAYDAENKAKRMVALSSPQGGEASLRCFADKVDHMVSCSISL